RPAIESEQPRTRLRLLPPLCAVVPRSARLAPLHTRSPPYLSPVSERLAVTFLRVLWRGYRRNLALVLRCNPSSFFRLPFRLDMLDARSFRASPRLNNRNIFFRQLYADKSESLALGRH